MTSRRLLQGAMALVVLGPLAGPQAVLAGDNALYSWDIVNVLGGCVAAGGEASSKSLDNARITVTGSGTFRDNPGNSQSVTGGGEWTITPGTATPAGSGTYEVTRFISFDLAPGAPPPIGDCIGDPEARRAGRLTVAILYSDGSEGVLEVGCRLVGSPGSIMEGVTATKGFVTFWNHEEPVPGAEGNRTIFHLLQ
jgi:hypothetical protein